MNIQLNHFALCLELAQYCKLDIPQLKKHVLFSLLFF